MLGKDEVAARLGSGIRRIAILGTGLIGASVGLALREAGYAGAIFGWDSNAAALAKAREIGAVDPAVTDEANEDPFVCALAADVVVLAGPVFSIAEWLEQLAPVLSPAQMVTDVGSMKGFLLERAGALYNAEGRPGWLPGHPMTGKEHAGAEHADGGLFRGAAWLFTGAGGAGDHGLPSHPYAAEWIGFVERFGSHTAVLAPERHDLLCASVSHLPQMLATALAAMLGEQFAGELAPELAALPGTGGRALREMTRLGASPYSMWRDIAMANEAALAAALLRMEQQLAYLRDNLRGPELRELFAEANTFRARLVDPKQT